MLPNVGLPELCLIAFLAMLFFGKDKLPDLAKGLGGSIKEFRNAINMGENKAEAKVKPKAETLEVAETRK